MVFVTNSEGRFRKESQIKDICKGSQNKCKKRLNKNTEASGAWTNIIIRILRIYHKILVEDRIFEKRRGRQILCIIALHLL